MKINLSLERYDIKSLEDIIITVRNMKKKIEILKSLGEHIYISVLNMGEDFDSINYFRMKEALEDYLRETRKFDDEIEELVQSVNQFIEKIEEIWR